MKSVVICPEPEIEIVEPVLLFAAVDVAVVVIAETSLSV